MVFGLSWYTRAIANDVCAEVNHQSQVPIASLAFVSVLWIYRRRVSIASTTPPVARSKQVLQAFRQVDFVGLLLFTAGISLFSLPIPLEQGGVKEYATARLLVPTVIGFVLLIVFGVWEAKFAKQPLLARSILSSWTVVAVLACKSRSPRNGFPPQGLTDLCKPISCFTRASSSPLRTSIPSCLSAAISASPTPPTSLPRTVS